MRHDLIDSMESDTERLLYAQFCGTEKLAAALGVLDDLVGALVTIETEDSPPVVKARWALAMAQEHAAALDDLRHRVADLLRRAAP